MSSRKSGRTPKPSSKYSDYVSGEDELKERSPSASSGHRKRKASDEEDDHSPPASEKKRARVEQTASPDTRMQGVVQQPHLPGSYPFPVVGGSPISAPQYRIPAPTMPMQHHFIPSPVPNPYQQAPQLAARVPPPVSLPNFTQVHIHNNPAAPVLVAPRPIAELPKVPETVQPAKPQEQPIVADPQTPPSAPAAHRLSFSPAHSTDQLQHIDSPSAPAEPEKEAAHSSEPAAHVTSAVDNGEDIWSSLVNSTVDH